MSAESYCQFYAYLPLHSLAEVAWWKRELEAVHFDLWRRKIIAEGEEEFHRYFATYLRDCSQEDYDDWVACESPDLTLVADPADCGRPGTYLRIYGDGTTAPVPLMHAIQRFFRELRLPRCFALGCAWVASKDVPDAWGGTAYFVTMAGVEQVDTFDWLRDKVQQHENVGREAREGKFRETP